MHKQPGAHEGTSFCVGFDQSRLWLFLLVTAVCTAGLSAQTSNGYERVKVAEGIYAFIAPEPKTGMVTSNQVLIVGEDSALVVDTGQFPGLARRIIAEIKQLTSKPVRYLLITHWHYDHALGTPEYLAAYPSVSVISHEVTRRELDARVEAFGPQATLKVLPAFRESTAKQLEGGKRADGTPLSEGDREYLKVLLDDIDAAPKALEGGRHVPPDLAFAGRLTIHLGKREVQLVHLGRGNTGGDVVAYVPDAKVLVTGDLVVSPTPYGIQCYYRDWVKTMEELARFDAVAIVPGHGQVMRDFSYVRQVRDLIAATIARVDEAVKDGLTLVETRRRVSLQDFRQKFAGDNHWRRRAFDDFWVAPAVTRLYRLAKGEVKEE